MLSRQRQLLFQSAPAWVLRGSVAADLDFDLANSRYYQRGVGQSGSPTNRFLTVSRASTGYASDLLGNYTSFASGVARITNQGLLVEEARTNGLLQSNTFATSPWAATNVSAVNGAGISPDGGNNASSIIDTAANALHQFGQSPSVSMTTGTVVSVFVRPAAQTWAGIQINNPGDTSASEAYFNLSGAGSVGSITTLVGSATIASSSITAYSNGWYRIAVVTTGTNATMFIGPASGDNGRAYAGTGTVSLYCWAAQSEAGGLFPTSPIITTTAAVTRAADVVTVTTSPVFGGSYTLYGAGTTNVPSNYAITGNILSLDDGTNNNRFFVGRASNGNTVSNAIYEVSGSITANISSPTPQSNAWPIGTFKKTAAAAQPGDQAVILAGNAISTGSGSGAFVPTIIHIGVRADGGNQTQFNGYLTRVAVWVSSRLSNAILQQLVA